MATAAAAERPTHRPAGRPPRRALHHNGLRLLASAPRASCRACSEPTGKPFFTRRAARRTAGRSQTGARRRDGRWAWRGARKGLAQVDEPLARARTGTARRSPSSASTPPPHSEVLLQRRSRGTGRDIRYEHQAPRAVSASGRRLPDRGGHLAARESNGQ